jgi:uncharacterized protein YacL (UPF0231 family)
MTATGLTTAMTAAKRLLQSDNVFGVLVEGASNIAGLNYILVHLKSFTAEERATLKKIELSLIKIKDRMTSINKQLYKYKICLDDDNIMSTQIEINKLLEKTFSNYFRQILSSAFITDFLKLINQLTFYFTVYLADFSQIVFAYMDPSDPVNNEILRTMQEMCSTYQKKIIQRHTGVDIRSSKPESFTKSASSFGQYRPIKMKTGSPDIQNLEDFISAGF